MNIILTGLRGTGKSSIGALLARRLNFTFIDTDAALEVRAKCRIADLVARQGWSYFRTLERQIVAQIAAADCQVVATGGGTLIDEENAQILKARGVVVLLVCDLPILQRRISRGSNRPSLTGRGSAVAELAQVWETRQARYFAVADLTYDVSVESTQPERDLQRKTADLHLQLQPFLQPCRSDHAV